jgi:hypothetical protein
MGQNVDNEMGPTPDHQGATFKGWCYAIGKGTPGSHINSPHMTRAQVVDLLMYASGTEQEWLDAHPVGVRGWLQQRPSAVRARFQANCQELNAL